LGILSLEAFLVEIDLQRINIKLPETLHMATCHKDIKYQVTNGSNIFGSSVTENPCSQSHTTRALLHPPVKRQASFLFKFYSHQDIGRVIHA
jgi:hypothetical protein